MSWLTPFLAAVAEAIAAWMTRHGFVRRSVEKCPMCSGRGEVVILHRREKKAGAP